MISYSKKTDMKVRDLSRLPQDVHVLILPSMNVLSQKPQQFWKTRLRARPRQAWENHRINHMFSDGVLHKRRRTHSPLGELL